MRQSSIISYMQSIVGNSLSRAIKIIHIRNCSSGRKMVLHVNSLSIIENICFYTRLLHKNRENRGGGG